MAKSPFGKKQLSDIIGEMQLHIEELENKFKASEVWEMPPLAVTKNQLE